VRHRPVTERPDRLQQAAAQAGQRVLTRGGASV
jgi:hypothetical protein